MQNPVSHDGERDWLTRVVDNLLDESLKLDYANWLEERGDARAAVLRDVVEAGRSMNADDFPDLDAAPATWVELIGGRLQYDLAAVGCPELRDSALRLARPALRMVTAPADDADIPLGASKIGGNPDLPQGTTWPTGDDCPAFYNNETTGVQHLAGFLLQIDLASIAETCAARDLPKAGLLSFFAYCEADDPDNLGVKAVHFPDASNLVRTEPPGELTDGNEPMESRTLNFEEVLDFPPLDSPWADEFNLEPDKQYWELLEPFEERSLANFLGYCRGQQEDDPTPSRQSRHLITIENAAECVLYVQIPAAALATANFDAITLEWVDFD